MEEKEKNPFQEIGNRTSVRDPRNPFRIVMIYEEDADGQEVENVFKYQGNTHHLLSTLLTGITEVTLGALSEEAPEDREKLLKHIVRSLHDCADLAGSYGQQYIKTGKVIVCTKEDCDA